MLGVSYSKNSIGGLMLGFFIMTAYALGGVSMLMLSFILVVSKRFVLSHDVF